MKLTRNNLPAVKLQGKNSCDGRKQQEGKGDLGGGGGLEHKRTQSQFKHSYTAPYSLKKHLLLAEHVFTAEGGKASFKIFK